MRIRALYFCLLAGSMAHAAADGGQPFAWQRLGFGARSAALGRASVTMGGDALSTLDNPAMLATLNDFQLGSQTAIFSDERRLDQLALVRPLLWSAWHPRGSLSLARYALDAPIEVRKTNTPDSSQDFFVSAYSLQIGLASWLGNPSTSHWSLGLDVRLLYEEIFEASGNGFALDWGLAWKPTKDCNLALSLHDLPSRIGWSTEASDSGPPEIRLGGSWRVWKERCLILTELDKNYDQDIRIRLGLECWAIPKRLALRAGLQQGLPSAGLGLCFEAFGAPLQFDYAVIAEGPGSGGPSQRISLLLAFKADDLHEIR